MNFNTREFPTPPIRLNASRKPGTLTIQPSNRSLSRKTSTVSLPSGAQQSARPGVRSNGKANYECSDPQQVQMLIKLRTAILVLDPCAKFFMDGESLNVIHSRCNGTFPQRAYNDLTHFREHVSVCRSIRSDIAAPARTTSPHRPGVGFEMLCGESHKSTVRRELPEAADLTRLDPGERKRIISKLCSERSPSPKNQAQSCRKIFQAVEPANMEGGVSHTNSRAKREFHNQFRSIDATTSARENKKAADDKT